MNFKNFLVNVILQSKLKNPLLKMSRRSCLSGGRWGPTFSLERSKTLGVKERDWVTHSFSLAINTSNYFNITSSEFSKIIYFTLNFYYYNFNFIWLRIRITDMNRRWVIFSIAIFLFGLEKNSVFMLKWSISVEKFYTQLVLVNKK